MSLASLHKQFNKTFLAYGKPLFGFFVCVGLLIVLIQNVSLFNFYVRESVYFLFAMMLLRKVSRSFPAVFWMFSRNKVANTNYKSFLFGFTVSSFGTVQRAGCPGYSDFFLECGINGLTVRHCHGLRHQFIYRRFCLACRLLRFKNEDFFYMPCP